MENYFEKDFITISYSKDCHAIVSKWLVAPTSKEFREGLNAIHSAFEYFKTGKLVADTTHAGALHPDDQEWVATEWFERAAKSGHSRAALIVPPEVFTQISIENVVSEMKKKARIPTEYFDSVEAAMEWIKGQ